MNTNYKRYGTFKYTFPFESKFQLSPKQLDDLSNIIIEYLNSLKNNIPEEPRIIRKKN